MPPAQKSAGDDQALGRSRGGFSTKIHLVVDALGYPVDLRLTGGHVHDATQAAALLSGKLSQYVIADKAYDANAIIALIRAQGAEPVIPPRLGTTPRKVDWHVYKERHLVECCINRLKRFRRFATRYEKTARNYLAMALIACILIWIGV
ncbi:IS5 family transposase [Vineibacter terrae]|uniref:IS5 family transposase n=1 Tax=Vineibacter terrae TaxID=2586908 RepID=UPI001C49876C|nr:IS5 family transposase [Vineibacter terrae]